MNHRPFLRLIRKHFIFLLIVAFLFSFLFLSFWKRNNGHIDEDAEELDIDLLKDKIIKLKRSHFLNNKPIEAKDDLENDSFEQQQPQLNQPNYTNLKNHHKRLFISSSNKTQLDDLNDTNDLLNNNCRNTVQGKIWITDDRGYTCKRYYLTPGGCCDQKHNPKRYSCETCNSQNCCEIIEFCISCCLEPDKKSLLQKVLTQQSALLSVNANRGIQALFASVTDHFELCLAKCRTSSQSVEHENSYVNSKYKYCFGLHNGNELKKDFKL